jgi:tripartite-type tricarboxylate transporter receptor subunit TctC
MLKFPRRQFLHLATGAAALPLLPHIARSQAYPSRPITMVVAFPAGGGSDAAARVIAERMRTSLGQPILVEKRQLEHTRCQWRCLCASV